MPCSVRQKLIGMAYQQKRMQAFFHRIQWKSIPFPHYVVYVPSMCGTARHGMTHSRIMSQLRIKCISLESWVDLNQKWGSILSHGSILFDSKGSHSSHASIWINTWESAWVASWFWVNSLESFLSHELIRFNFPRYCLNHDLIQINFSRGHLSRKPVKGDTNSNGMGQILKVRICRGGTWSKAQKSSY